MSRYVRISDEKNARWHEIQHRIRMDQLHELEERTRVLRTIACIDRCPHCGHAIAPQSFKP
jgi:hypothetical protein